MIKYIHIYIYIYIYIYIFGIIIKYICIYIYILYMVWFSCWKILLVPVSNSPAESQGKYCAKLFMPECLVCNLIPDILWLRIVIGHTEETCLSSALLLWSQCREDKKTADAGRYLVEEFSWLWRIHVLWFAFQFNRWRFVVFHVFFLILGILCDNWVPKGLAIPSLVFSETPAFQDLCSQISKTDLCTTV